jgi:hypothetical protein
MQASSTVSVSSITLPTYRLYSWGNFPYNVTRRSFGYNPYAVPAYTIQSPNSAYDFTLHPPVDDGGNETALSTYYSFNNSGRSIAVTSPNSQVYATSYPYSFRVNTQKLMNPYSSQSLLIPYTPTDITYNPVANRYQTRAQYFETSTANLQAYLDANNSFYLPYLRLQITQKGSGYTVVQQADGSFTLTETATDGLDTIGVVNTPQSILSRFSDSSTTIAPDIFALIEAASFPLTVPNFGNSSLEVDPTTTQSPPLLPTNTTQEVPPPPVLPTEVGNAAIPLIAILPAQKSPPNGNNTAITSVPPPLVPPFFALQNPTKNTINKETDIFFKMEQPFFTTPYNNASVQSGVNSPFSAMEALRLQDFRRPFAFPLPQAGVLPLAEEAAFSGKSMDFTQMPAGFGNMANLGEHQELNRQRATGEPLIARQFRIRRLRQAIQSLK